MLKDQDTPEGRVQSRARGYRGRGGIHPSERAQERYSLSQFPCSRCASPKEGLPHLADNGSEFYWEHQHDSPGGSARSGCPRFGGRHCGDRPKPGTATSLFRRLEEGGYTLRGEEEYVAAQHAVEHDGVDDARERFPRSWRE